jgi:hypothetical protein
MFFDRAANPRDEKMMGAPLPEFPISFGDPTSFMRLSLMKAAHGVLGGAAYRKFGSSLLLA